MIVGRMFDIASQDMFASLTNDFVLWFKGIHELALLIDKMQQTTDVHLF